MLLNVTALTFALLFSYSVQAATQLSVSTNNITHEYDVSSYGGSSQDIAGTVDVRDAGLSLFLEGNRWQKIDFPYTVTADTVIEFDFQSTVEGEILGLGFDNDLNVNSDKSFKIYGTQNWGISNFDTYSGSGATHFIIPVGQFYTGNFQYLFFINDDDSSLTSNSLYSNIVVYEKPKPLVEYRFEDTSWNGTTGEVIDSSGNGHHGRMKSNSTPLTLLPALTSNPGTCGYASQNDGSIEVTGLPLDNSTYGVKTTVTFWMNWDGTNGVMPIGWGIHDIWIVDGSMGFNTGNSDVYGISSAGLANGWHHVSVEFTNGSVTSNRMYVDGVEQVLTQRRSSPNNSRAIVGSELRIGGWSHDNGYKFHGLMDEVRVYQNALTTSQVNTIMAERHPCPSTPLAEYRFDELSWDGTANEVIDNSGNNHHGAAIGMTTLSSGKICAAGDFTATGTSDYLNLANTAANNLTDFTISVWAIKNFTHTGTILSGANAGQKNEMIMFFPNNDTFSPHIKASTINLSNGGIGDSSWHHLVWTRTGTTQCYYVDGTEVQCGTIGQGGSLVIDPGGLIIGQEQDALGGSFDANQAWDGLLDELIIFNSAIPVSQINRIYTNQNAGNNYDGSARSCPVPAIPLLEYRFEEDSWNGVAGEILDNTGNGYHAQALRDSILVNPAPATAPSAIPGDPGTCGYTSQSSGAIQATGLPLDTTTVGVKTTVTFWMNWNGIENVMPIGWYIHDIWMVSGSMGFNSGSGDLYGISSAGLANGWHHVTVEFTNGNVTDNRMYIDGVEQVLTQRLKSPNNGRAVVDSEFRVGGWRANASYDFQGFMDEVRIYQGVLTTTQVNTIMNEVHPCIPVVDHYQITHDGNGLTCAPEPVLIRACSNANCSSFNNTINTTVTMQINGGADQNITIVNGSSVNENFVYIDPDNPAVLSLTSDFSCSNTSDNSAGCAVNFAKAGFLLNLDNHQSCTTPNLTIKAVKLSDSGLDCAPAYTGNQSVNFIFNYSDPFNGTEVPSLATVDMAAATDTQTRTITFDGTGTANLSFNYQDAGKIRIDVSDAAAAGLTASSVTAVVTPAKLIVASPDANADCATSDAVNATCSVFKVAGAPFNLNITAACSNNTVTKNFKMNNIPLSVTTIAPNIAPNVANLVTLGVTSIDVLETDKGSHQESNQTISEVGVFTITATPPINGYFGETIPAAVSANIGRFIPDHFDVSITHRSFEDTCTTGTSDFTYIGQPFTYLNAPELLITAKNFSGVTTKNYTETDYQKLTATNIGRTFPMKDTSKDGTVVKTKMVVVAITSDGNLTTPASDPKSNAGEMTYTFDSLDSFTYSKNANSEVGPFTSIYDIVINSIADSEGANASTSLAFNVPSTNTVSPDGVNLRFGRVSIENSFGPETSPIKQVLSVEDYNGTDFVLADTDTCTQYNSANVSFGSINSVGLNSADITAVSGAFIDIDDLPNGVTRQIVLPAVAAGNQGKVEVIYTIYPRLQYDWHWNGIEVKTFDENPSAIATFGLYRGNDRIIYSREVFD